MVSTTPSDPIDLHTLTRSIRCVIEAHEMLRITVHPITRADGRIELVQQVHPVSYFQGNLYTVADFSNESENRQIEMLKDELRDLALTDLRLDEQVFAFKLVVLQTNLALLAVNVHCIVHDSASMFVIIRDLLRYAGGCGEVQVLSLKDQMACSVNVATPDVVREEIDEWKAVLQGVNKVLRLTDPDMPNSPSDCQYTLAPFTHEAQNSLQSISRILGVSKTVLLMAVLTCALGTLAGQDDCLLGLISPNRTDEERNYIGCYANALPLRVDFSSGMTFKQLVGVVSKNWDMVVNSSVCLTDLVNTIPCLKRKPDQDHSLFRIFLSENSFNMTIPTLVGIQDAIVDVKFNQNFHINCQTDLVVNIRPKGLQVQNSSLHYQFLKHCLNPNIISIFHTEVSSFLLQAETNLNGAVSFDSFPKLKILSEWRNRIIPNLPQLNLPLNMSPKTEDPYVVLETVVNTFELKFQPSLLMAAFAYVMCRYCDQDRIGVLLVRNRKVVGLCFDRLTGLIERVIESFTIVVEQNSEFELAISEFNAVMKSLEKYRDCKYLVWCEDDTDPTCLQLSTGMHVNFTPFGNSLLLKLSSRTEWFDNITLPTIVKSFEYFYKNVGRYRFEDVPIEHMSYWQKNVTYDARPQLGYISHNKCYITQLESKTQRYQNYVALSHLDNHMTYTMMFQQMLILGAMVHKNSIKYGGNHIGIYLTRSPLLYVAMLAILRAGLAYVPIALDLSRQLILSTLKHSRVNIVLTESALLPNLNGYTGKVICVDALLLFEEPFNRPIVPETNSQTLSCILFTSGTTGTPKGVMMSNRNLLQAIDNAFVLSTPAESAITLAATDLIFDAHIIDSLTPLLRGCRLVISEGVANMLPGVTHAFATPSSILSVDIPDSICSLVIGGEEFTRGCYEKIKHVRKVVKIYGPTECSVFVSCLDVSNLYDPDDPCNIGEIVPGCSYQILNSFGKSVPPGFPGILYISGYNVTKGYCNNMDLTKQSFHYIGDGYIYCTGDHVRLLHDKGMLRFIGRMDYRVKFKGYSFDMLEVETAIRSFPSVSNACLFIHDRDKPSAELIACVSPDDVSIGDLRCHLQSFVPSFMIPKVFVPLKEFPLNKVGKIDRARLKTIVDSIMDSEETSRETKRLAKELVIIFAQVLEVESESFSIEDNFLAKGGNSLLAVTLAIVINQTLCTDVIHASHLLKHLTPLGLANHIAEKNCDIVIAEEPKRKSISDKAISEFLINPGDDFDKISFANICSELMSTTQSCVVIPKEANVKGTIRESGRVSFSFIQDCQYKKENVLELAIQIPDTQGPMLPVQHYYKKVLPIQALQLVAHPESLVDFGFLDSVPPISFSNRFHEALESGNYEVASASLAEVTTVSMPPEIIEAYATVYNCPEEMFLKHIKARSFLSFKPSRPVVTLRSPITTEDSLFFIHGDVTGRTRSYLLLAKGYKLRSVALQHTINTPTDSFANMAIYYAEAILSVQPQGPYSLLGLGYGACLTYEVAHLLVAEGQRVKLLVMINDSPVHEYRPALFDLYGRPIPGTALDPMVFFTRLLNLPFPHSKLSLSPDRSDLQNIVDTLAEMFEWMDFTAEDLTTLYMTFYSKIKCLWEHTASVTADGIDACVLIRDESHPFFKSEDFGLSQLLNPAILEVATCDRSIGHLMQQATVDFVLETISKYL